MVQQIIKRSKYGEILQKVVDFSLNLCAVCVYSCHETVQGVEIFDWSFTSGATRSKADCVQTWNGISHP